MNAPFETAHKKRFHPRKMFITGILSLIPLGVTLWLLNFLVSKTNEHAQPIVRDALHLLDDSFSPPDWVITTISIIVVLAFIMLIGWLANFYFGKKILSLVDSAMLRLPFIRSVYGGVKQIIEAFTFQSASGSFKKVVMFEYPRKGCWALGFVTNESYETARKLYGRDLVAVFMPSTPNPTTGFLLYMDPFELFLIDLKVEEAIKLIVSAGLVAPTLHKNLPVSLGESLMPDRLQEPEPTEKKEPVKAL